MQNASVPLKSAELVSDVAAVYGVIDEVDVLNVLGCIDLSEEALIACVGVSGPDEMISRMEGEAQAQAAAQAEKVAVFGKLLGSFGTGDAGQPASPQSVLGGLAEAMRKAAAASPPPPPSQAPPSPQQPPPKE